MLSNEPTLIRISQGQLNVLERCPRKFQNTYLEQLYSPIDPEQEKRQILGSRFHLIMQQISMGLPIDSFLKTNTQIQTWIETFVAAAPEIIDSRNKPLKDISNHSNYCAIAVEEQQNFRESEHYRTLQVKNYLLTVIYDLLIADSSQAQIVDWKTYPKPPTKRKLEANWQTRLYLYLLAQTSNYPPENISMTYWFFPVQGKLESIKFNYNSLWHQQTAKKLERLLNQLTKFLNSYHQGESFPQVAEGKKVCNFCQYATRCGRQNQADQKLEADRSAAMNLAIIEEVSL